MFASPFFLFAFVAMLRKPGLEFTLSSTAEHNKAPKGCLCGAVTEPMMEEKEVPGMWDRLVEMEQSVNYKLVNWQVRQVESRTVATVPNKLRTKCVNV